MAAEFPLTWERLKKLKRGDKLAYYTKGGRVKTIVRYYAYQRATFRILYYTDDNPNIRWANVGSFSLTKKPDSLDI